MKLLSKVAIVLAALPVLAMAAPAYADSPGQLAGGSNVYEVRDDSTGGSYAASANASACDTVEFSTELNNGGYGNLTNVIVKANLPSTTSTSITSTVTGTPDQGSNYGTTGSATVNFSTTQNLSYVNGTTKLYDISGNLIETLGDTVTSSGVNVGTIGGSTTEFLDFQAKASCAPVTPVSFSATETANATASATANASANCAKGSAISVADASATSSASASASASATSSVSQADANQQALAAAQAAANAKAQAAAQAQAQASANSAASAKCAPGTTPTTTVQTSTPAALPNTGPGDVVEVFAGTSSLGAVGNFLFRRFRR